MAYRYFYDTEFLDGLPEQQGTEHNAMEDALHVKHCYDVLAPYIEIGRAA